jgi:hypothetical protein
MFVKLIYQELILIPETLHKVFVSDLKVLECARHSDILCCYWAKANFGHYPLTSTNKANFKGSYNENKENSTWNALW